MLVSFPPNMVKLWMSANILAVGVWIRSGTKYRTFSTGILNQCCTWCISDDCFVSKAHSSQKLTRQLRVRARIQSVRACVCEFKSPRRGHMTKAWGRRGRNARAGATGPQARQRERERDLPGHRGRGDPEAGAPDPTGPRRPWP